MTADFALPRIDLALEADFQLGRLYVRPATLQVENGGRLETQEPRVMRVLVALVRKREQVVSRDELIQTCWDGRIVGEDALNRCIYRLRKLGQVSGAFGIETVPRVGYRLLASLEPAQAGVRPSAPAPPSGLRARSRLAAAGRTWMLLALGISALALSLLGWMMAGQNSQRAGLGPSIAVLPFANATGDPARDYLAHGIAAELVETLSQIDRLQIIARGSSFAYAPDADPLTIGKALDVANVLSGSVSEEGGGVRISFDLADAKSGRTILSKTYSTALTTDNMAAAQRYIAEQVAGSLSVAFDVRGGGRLMGTGTRSMEAYDFYLQGLEVMAGDSAASEDQFAKAVSADPDYAAAWGLRAIAHGSKSWSQPTPAEGRAVQDMAYAMAKKAVALDPNISTSQATFANLSTTQHKWGEAEIASLHALELSVNEIALGQRQLILLRAGRITDADALNPLIYQVAPHGGVGASKYTMLSALGRLDELRALLDGANRGRADISLLARLEAQIDLGGPPKAVRETLQAIAGEPDRMLSEFAKALLVVFGDNEKARRMLHAWYNGPGFETPLKYELVPFLAAWYGDTDLVLQVWRDDLPLNVVRMTKVWGPAFAPARARPEFKALMQDIGLVDYWRAYEWANKCRPLGPSDFECG